MDREFLEKKAKTNKVRAYRLLSVMTPQTFSSSLSFSEAARVVQRRLILRKGLLALSKTWPYFVGLLLALAILRFLGFGFASPALAFALLASWIGLVFFLSWQRKGDVYTAFAFWDQQTKRGDAFANAWWFEKLEVRSPGQQLHLERETSRLPQAMGRLRHDLPLPKVYGLAALPLFALLLNVIPTGVNSILPDLILTKQGQEIAVQEGRKLAEKKLEADKLNGLSEEEKKDVEKLQQKLQDTAQTLQDKEAKTSREILKELEQRARDTEKLAEKMAAGEAAWASEKMIGEMRKHADTAELGDAAASKKADDTSLRAQDLADLLKSEKLPAETRERLAETFKEIGKKAEPEDKEKTVGQHVLKADRNLAQTLTQEAGQELQALADKMKTLAQREKTREQLEKLAQQLRDMGTNIAGEGQQGMQQLANQEGESNQGQNASAQSSQMMNLQNAPQLQAMQTPSMSNSPPSQAGQGQGQNQQLMTPVPGSAQLAEQGQTSSDPSSGKGQNDKPMLFAPIPGMQPGDQPAAALLATVPGMNGAGQQAGSGKSDMGNRPTGKTNAGQAGVVNAQRNAEGASAVRSVEGQARPEQATRQTQPTTLEAISAEENALDDAALPAARREQVRRYFTELRKRFEKSN